MTNLTTNQRKAVETIDNHDGATAHQIADALDYSSVSGVYDLLRRASTRDTSFVFDSDDAGVWTYNRVAADGGTTVESGDPTTHRVPTAQKQTITKTANDFLSELEVELRDRLQYYEPTSVDLPQRSRRRDMVMFRTDDHFGAKETSVTIDGEETVTFNSEMAADSVYQHLDEVLDFRNDCNQMGVKFDTVHLLMNGDHVTNESIFQGQQYHIDKTLRGQMRDTSEVYVDVIRTLSDEFPAVQVVCQHGNHGELRAKGSSNQANADDLLYDSLDLAIRQSDISNVDIKTNHVDTHTEFRMRDHIGYMRHGQDTLGHIGTNSAKQRWLAWLQESADRNQNDGWDVGYVGHNHDLKWEPVAGRPVLMGGTLEPAGDYVNSLGIAPGKPGAWTHTVSNSEPIDLIRPIYFN